MPFFLTAAGFSAITGVFVRFLIGTWLFKLFVGLGITYVTFQASDHVGNLISSKVQSLIGGLPSQFMEVFVSVGGMSYINLVLSAYMGALAIRAAIGAAGRFKFGGSQ